MSDKASLHERTGGPWPAQDPVQLLPTASEDANRRVRCRPIETSDLDDVVDLLCRGFPERSTDYWRRGLARHAARTLPDGCPKFGYVMVAGRQMVGVVLTLYTAFRDPGAAGVKCNLSSWYVVPAYRPYATLLDRMAMRHAGATFTNISPAPHTLPMHEARGFERSSRGQVLAVPLLSRRRPGASVEAFATATHGEGLSEAERRLATDHAAYGCLSLVASDEHGPQPFVFVRRPIGVLKRRLGMSPVDYAHLVYCRSVAELPRFSHALGRHLLMHHGIAVITVDSNGPIAGLIGRYRDGQGTKLKRGRGEVEPGDLAYSELVIFGP